VVGLRGRAPTAQELADLGEGRVVTSQDVAFGGVYDAEQGHGVVESGTSGCVSGGQAEDGCGHHR
jgi:hypothetical protein